MREGGWRAMNKVSAINNWVGEQDFYGFSKSGRVGLWLTISTGVASKAARRAVRYTAQHLINQMWNKKI